MSARLRYWGIGKPLLVAMMISASAVALGCKSDPGELSDEEIKRAVSKKLSEDLGKAKLYQELRSERAPAELILGSASASEIAMAAMYLNGALSGQPTPDTIRILDAVDTLVKIDRMEALLRSCDSRDACAKSLNLYKLQIEVCARSGTAVCTAHHDGMREVLAKYGAAAVGRSQP
ncbi:hypothetical protein WME76_46595 (plasmid) [Sorangium sp. So ce119]|uniref:hypothetical protein n=1 Tax=Sorangium sp. So ce119 TaxID=3133279 RepID=UPI003F5F69B7